MKIDPIVSNGIVAH